MLLLFDLVLLLFDLVWADNSTFFFSLQLLSFFSFFFLLLDNPKIFQNIIRCSEKDFTTNRKYDNSPELLLDSTTIILEHSNEMTILNLDSFTLTIMTTPESILAPTSTAPFTVAPSTPEPFGVMKVPLTCGELTLSEHVTRDLPWNYHPVSLVLGCDAGFRLEGATHADCLLDGTWSFTGGSGGSGGSGGASSPTCVADSSSSPLAPLPSQENCYGRAPPSPGMFGVVNYTNTTASYMCAEGTALMYGPAVRNCTNNGVWEGEDTMCALAVWRNQSRIGISIGTSGTSKLETEIRFGDGEQYISLIFLHREIPLYQRTSRTFTVEKHSLGRLVTMYLDDELVFVVFGILLFF